MERLRILLVEDEEEIRTMLAEALNDAGFDVTPAHGSGQAMAAIERDTFQAVVTDVDLRSGANGWDVARKARERMDDVPVVYMTGGSASDWSSKGVPHSVLVPKPFAPAQIVSAVSTLLNIPG